MLHGGVVCDEKSSDARAIAPQKPRCGAMLTWGEEPWWSGLHRHEAQAIADRSHLEAPLRDVTAAVHFHEHPLYWLRPSSAKECMNVRTFPLATTHR